MARLLAVQQVEVLEHADDGRVQRKGKPPLGTRASQESAELLLGDVRKRGSCAGRGVEGTRAQRARALEMLDEARVERGGQLGNLPEPAADQLVAGHPCP